MENTFSPITRAEKDTTHGPHESGIYSTRFFFTVEGSAAHAVENAQRANFYGIHGNTREAAHAQREIQEAITAWLDVHAPVWIAYYIESAEAIDTDGTPTPYRAKVCVTVDSPTRKI